LRAVYADRTPARHASTSVRPMRPPRAPHTPAHRSASLVAVGLLLAAVLASVVAPGGAR